MEILGLPILEELKLSEKYNVKRMAIKTWEITKEGRKRIGENSLIA